MCVTVASVAACSTQNQSENSRTLAQDSSLVTRVRAFQYADKQTDKQAGKPTFPAACGTFMIPAAAAGDTARARVLAERAYAAELLANLKEASSLLQRASELDATNKSAAYHLGRVSEALGDRRAAIQAYCRYLALSPTAAERTEVHARVVSLSQATTPSHPMVVAAAPRIVRQPKRETHLTSAIANGAIDAPTRAQAETTSPPVQRSAGPVVVDSDAVEVERPLPPVEQPRPERRSSNQIQSAGIGAIAGAILGGAVGRSAKSAAIGAVAGGIVGAVTSRGTHARNGSS